ncbi:hypothetical protein ACFQXA_10010 [Nocardiopsis composta]
MERRAPLLAQPAPVRPGAAPPRRGPPHRRLQRLGAARRRHLRPHPFAERARTVQGDLHRAVDHGGYGGVEVLRDLARRNGGAPVLAPVVYTSAIGLGPLFTGAVQECFGRPVHIISQGPQVLLDAQVTELDGGLLLNWDLREHAFEPGTMTAAFDRYRRLVDELVDDPQAWDRPVAPDAPRSGTGRGPRTPPPASPRPRPAHCTAASSSTPGPPPQPPR